MLWVGSTKMGSWIGQCNHCDAWIRDIEVILTLMLMVANLANDTRNLKKD